MLSILHWNKYVFNHEMFGSAPIYDRLISCMRWSYTPGIIRKYQEQLKIMENLVRYARKKKVNILYISDYCHWEGGSGVRGGGVTACQDYFTHFELSQ